MCDIIIETYIESSVIADGKVHEFDVVWKVVTPCLTIVILAVNTCVSHPRYQHSYYCHVLS